MAIFNDNTVSYTFLETTYVCIKFYIPLQIVVVPDSAAAQKVPPVPGILEYRKDTKKLYVRSNETWNAIGEETKVTNAITNTLAGRCKVYTINKHAPKMAEDF